jgi:hypothetical protein
MRQRDNMWVSAELTGQLTGFAGGGGSVTWSVGAVTIRRLLLQADVKRHQYFIN